MIRVHVLVDKSGPGRVYLETKTRNRTFDSVWKPKEVMIFRDIRGRLESEELVGKDIHDPLELCRRLESQDSWIRTQGPDWKPLVQETLRSPNISVRIRVDSLNKHPADISGEWPSAPVPFSRQVGPEDQRVSPTYRAYTQDSPQARTHRNPQTAAPTNQSTSSFQSIVTITSSPTSSIIAQSSFQSTHPRGTPSTPQEPRKSVSSARNVMLSQAPVPPPPHSPSSSTRSTDPPSESNGDPLITNPGRGNRDIRHPGPQSTAPSNLLPGSEETKPPPTQNQAKSSTNVVGTPKSPTPIGPRTSMPQQPPPLQMPGMFPGVPVDADTSSSATTNPVEVPKVSWYRRLFTRTRHA
ncbi:hypothetical protein BJV78DRAFT_418028 [Lactifluus subvellereus]|nr:hypothetical protein BJV78DRAFT_418028 [Lactifluus subvellereus]